MARKYQWGKEKFAAIVAGNHDSGLDGLRKFFRGFDAKDGYDLRKIDEWTPYQKKKVKTHFRYLELLQAQPKRAIHARGDNLKKLQEAFHGGIPSKNMKVALVPDTEPKLTVKGAKASPPKVKLLKEGISISRENYERVFIPFNHKALARNAKKEIQRVADHVPDARLYYIQCGEYQNSTGRDIGLVIKEVLKYVELYDGKKQLPNTSGNRGDDPKVHHWKHWLKGLIGYVVPDHVDIRDLARIIKKGRDANKLLVDDRQRYMRRAGRKGRT